MNIENASARKIWFSFQRSIFTHCGNASITRFGNNCPNDAKIPKSNDRVSNGSIWGQRWVFNWSVSARFRIMFDDEIVVITSKLSIGEFSIIFHRRWRCSRIVSENRSEPKKTMFNGFLLAVEYQDRGKRSDERSRTGRRRRKNIERSENETLRKCNLLRSTRLFQKESI